MEKNKRINLLKTINSISFFTYFHITLLRIQKTFNFKTKDIKEMYSIFRQLDYNATGYVNLDAIYMLIMEEHTSVVVPFLESFFGKIDKEYPDRVSFVEFLPAVSAFCLYTREQIMAFVFETLDLDDDKTISKTDIL